MQFIPVILLVGLVFGLCWLVDKGITKLFRSQAQHQSGLAVRMNKRYGSMGIIVALLGAAGLVTGLVQNNVASIVGGVILIIAGLGLSFYYLTNGIFYDADSILYCSFGKKSRTYRYNNIVHQQLYVVQGGHYIVELHMTDKTSVMVQSQMEGAKDFLAYANKCWCHQKGVEFTPKPDEFIYFPSQEDV